MPDSTGPVQLLAVGGVPFAEGFLTAEAVAAMQA
jgi:hypothetical protein